MSRRNASGSLESILRNARVEPMKTPIRLPKFDLRRLGLLSVLLDIGRMRAFARRSELGLAAAGFVVGITSGLAVTLMSWIFERPSPADLWHWRRGALELDGF